jgi:type IV pilus assembly protein PilC
MPSFRWEGRARGGDIRRGEMVADNEEAVMVQLRADQITPTSVKKKPKEINISIGSGVSAKDLVVFTRQFATMIDAGLPLVQCLEILGTRSDNKHFGKILMDVKSRVEQGGAFSDALKAHPKVFDDLYANLVAAGELGGILDTIMTRLAVYIEKKEKLRSQVKGAMVYPIAILSVAIVVVFVLLTWVIPVFEAMFKDMGAGALPTPTKIVIELSNFFATNFVLIVIAFAAVIFAMVAFGRSKTGRRVYDIILLRIPIIGAVLRKVAVARFSRTLGTLLSSGVPVLDALEITAKTSGNKIIEEAISTTRLRVSEGKDLASPLMETAVFPPMVVQMVAVGEQTGAMDQMLNKIADFYEDEVDVAVTTMTKLMEPAMMVLLGGIVGGLIIAMYLPIFELAGHIKAE